ncbi:MAG: hypothetical protein M0R03_20105 [Novosphingobium sp.]|nr:hypothetical protein [Novosphingobium sp.]
MPEIAHNGRIGGRNHNMKNITVDLVDERNKPIFRFYTDCLPRIGETITMLSPKKKEFEVLKVDHLISRKPISEELIEFTLATITVREKKIV